MSAREIITSKQPPRKAFFLLLLTFIVIFRGNKSRRGGSGKEREENKKRRKETLYPQHLSVLTFCFLLHEILQGLSVKEIMGHAVVFLPQRQRLAFRGAGTGRRTVGETRDGG